MNAKTLHGSNGRLEKFKAEKFMEGYIYTTHCQEATCCDRLGDCSRDASPEFIYLALHICFWPLLE